MKIKAAAAAALLWLGMPAEASITFQFEGVTFDDGGTATGSFTTDDGRTSVTAFSLATSPGTFYLFNEPTATDTQPTAGRTYTAPETGASIFTGSRFQQITFDGPAYFALSVDGRLQLGSNMLYYGQENVFIYGRRVASGQLVGTPTSSVPEPAMWLTLVAGFGLIGAALRHAKSMIGDDLLVTNAPA